MKGTGKDYREPERKRSMVEKARKILIVLSFLAPFNVHPIVLSAVDVLYDFGANKCGWVIDSPRAPSSSLSLSRAYAARGRYSLKLSVEFPGKVSVKTTPKADWSKYRKIGFSLLLPKGGPEGIEVLVYLKDSDFWWYQTLPQVTLKPGQWTKIEVDITGESNAWEGKGHFKPWDGHVTQRVREFGLAIFSNSDYKGPIYLDNVRAELKSSYSDRAEPRLYNFEVSSDTVKQYEKFEITFNLPGVYSNPFDPKVIDIEAYFISPSGKTLTIPAFFYQDYTRLLNERKEQLIPRGRSCWKIRFAPTEAGTYQYHIVAKDKKAVVQTRVRTFRVEPSNFPGFIRVNARAPYYFVFDSGETYYAIGHNVGWPSSRGTYDYDDYFTSMGKNGENFARIWMIKWGNLALEWNADQPPYRGLGRYSLENAWRLDYILDLAARNGIYIQLVLNNHGQFVSRRGGFGHAKEAEWQDNPYNIVHGGPLSSAGQVFTKERAKELFKQRYRYLVARYGYSPHILSWSLWNEVDQIDRYNPNIVARWHQEMGRYFDQIDPWNHLITTSYCKRAGGGPTCGGIALGGDPRVWSSPEIDYTQTLGFTPGVGVLSHWIESRLQYGKPVIIREYGDYNTHRRDTEGILLHNGIWFALMYPTAGTPLYWWWDTDIHKFNLYYHFRALANFLADDKNLLPYLKKSNLKATASGPGTLSLIPGLGPNLWERSRKSQFKIKLSAPITYLEGLSAYIQGKAHPELKVSPLFEVSYPQGGLFVIEVGETAKRGATIEVYVDNRLVLNRKLRGGIPRDGNTQEFKIKIPAGDHTVKINNPGKDWFVLNQVILDNYIPKIRAIGRQNQTCALLWIQDRKNTVKNFIKGIPPKTVEGLKVTLSELLEGTYQVEVWDTYQGKITSTYLIDSIDGTLLITLPPFKRDIACKVRKIEMPQSVNRPEAKK